jgi:hypothetical protein
VQRERIDVLSRPTSAAKIDLVDGPAGVGDDEGRVNRPASMPIEDQCSKPFDSKGRQAFSLERFLFFVGITLNPQLRRTAASRRDPPEALRPASLSQIGSFADGVTPRSIRPLVEFGLLNDDEADNSDGYLPLPSGGRRGSMKRLTRVPISYRAMNGALTAL